MGRPFSSFGPIPLGPKGGRGAMLCLLPIKMVPRVTTIARGKTVMETQTLKSIAASLRKNLDDATRARSSWIENVLQRASLLFKAREQHASDAEFGRWLAEEHIEINPHGRAALLKMAAHPAETRAVLETTESWDLRRIWENEISPALYGQRPETPVDSPKLSLPDKLDAMLSGIDKIRADLIAERPEGYRRGMQPPEFVVPFPPGRATPAQLETARMNLDPGTLKWIGDKLQKWLIFAIDYDNFDLAGFTELIAKARERLHGTEAELITWLRGLGVPVADNLTIEERVRTGVRRAYDRKKNGGAAEVLAGWQQRSRGDRNDQS